MRKYKNPRVVLGDTRDTSILIVDTYLRDDTVSTRSR